MDVLQKEIDEVYATQLIADEILDNGVVEQHQRFIHSLTEINGGCAVISDLSNRKSYIAVHPWAHFLGLTPEEAALSVIDSMDEDCIYRRIHPEDLVEKRLLEYQFFQKTFSMSSEERLKYRGRCRIRMMNEKGVYQYIDNLVQIMENTPSEFVMIGNSLKSDIQPVLSLGGYGIHIPFEVMWKHEVVDTFTHDHLKQVKRFDELLLLF
jgi:hypothetical protein